MVLHGDLPSFTDLLLSMEMPALDPFQCANEYSNAPSTEDSIPESCSRSGSTQRMLSADEEGGTGESNGGHESLPRDIQGGGIHLVTTEDQAQTEADAPPDSWKKRHRRQGFIPEFREPSSGRKSSLEATLSRFAHQRSDAVVTPEAGMEFDSLPEAYDFYNLYSWEAGFGIRYGQSKKNSMQCKVGQYIACACAGKPRRLNTTSLASGCQAMISLCRTDDNGWYIHEFKQSHNHKMSLTCGEKLNWASHRNIDHHTKSLITNLRDNNVGLAKVYSVVGSFFGSMENVPSNKRALRSLCGRISKDQSDDDVKKTCELFSVLKAEDPNFVDSAMVDKDRKIRALMWTNGKSRMQYKHFGDAITFDTTYRCNQYDMPCGLFVGVNNHFQSIILGGVLMTNETPSFGLCVFMR